MIPNEAAEALSLLRAIVTDPETSDIVRERLGERLERLADLAFDPFVDERRDETELFDATDTLDARETDPSYEYTDFGLDENDEITDDQDFAEVTTDEFVKGD